MGSIVDIQEAGGIDPGIYLRGGQAGMPQQFLNAAKVPASTQQVRRKGMA